VFKGAPGVILINERSASSSEIVAGAMHDGAVAYLIGAKSSGRVNLSRSFPVGGGLLYVTIGRTGIGNPERSLTGIGVQPDEVVAHSIQALSQNRDLQLERAVTYLRDVLNAANGLP
jgi:carboxyl-terminal processing protease